MVELDARRTGLMKNFTKPAESRRGRRKLNAFCQSEESHVGSEGERSTLEHCNSADNHKLQQPNIAHGPCSHKDVLNTDVEFEQTMWLGRCLSCVPSIPYQDHYPGKVPKVGMMRQDPGGHRHLRQCRLPILFANDKSPQAGAGSVDASLTLLSSSVSCEDSSSPLPGRPAMAVSSLAVLMQVNNNVYSKR